MTITLQEYYRIIDAIRHASITESEKFKLIDQVITTLGHYFVKW